MQFGDTADCKSALRVRRVKNLCNNARSWEIALQGQRAALSPAVKPPERTSNSLDFAGCARFAGADAAARPLPS
jgi:hypothetical protein